MARSAPPDACEHEPDGDRNDAGTALPAAADLPPGARLVLWSMRYRVALLKRRRGPDALLEQVFRWNDADDALAPLDALVVLIARTATRGVEVRCPGCPGVAADEMTLIRACADGARDDERSAALRLSAMVPGPAASFAAAYAAGIGRTLAAAGLPPAVDPVPAGAARRAPAAVRILH
jgi:hypothetical protein